MRKAFQKKRGAKLLRRLPPWAALSLLFTGLAAASFALAPGASAAAAQRRAGVRAPSAAARPSAAPLSSAPLISAPLLPAAAIFQAAPLATYSDDCSTPQTDFTLGEVVCVKVSGAPVGAYPTRRVILANTASFTFDSLPVTSPSQTFTFTLPGASTSDGIDNRGTWFVGLVDTSDATLTNAVLLTIHDPAQQVADLTISKAALDSTSQVAGSDVSYQIYIWNRGPDAATNAHFADNTLPNTTFVSLTQDSGPAFTCTTPAAGSAGTSTCARGTAAAPLTFPKGAAAVFTAVYHVNSSIPNNAELSDTATVDSDTFDSADSSNSSTVDSTASNPNPPACTISCPANVTQDSDPGQAGAVVTYAAPVTSGSCGQVTTDRPSGSFFPIGTTVVTADAGNGTTCSFTVTVNDKRGVVITLNGSAVMTAECRTGFSDPGATATDGANNLQVTTAVTVPDPSGAVDQNGDAVQVPAPNNVVDPNAPNTYTITYSATAANNETGSAKRVVQVVDTAPPVITLANTGGFTPQTENVTVTNDDGTTSTVAETILVGTIECHGSIGIPTATAFDGCDNHPVNVTATGSVNPDAPGVYELVYKASDASGNDAEQRVRVTVVDTQKPVITLNGPSAMSILRTSAFTDPGATAADGCAGPVPVTVTGSVDTNTAGVYTLTYHAVDPSGNAADPVTRTVTVYVYTFTGFFSPINNSAINQVNAGRSVPVKFSLSGNQGLGIMAAGSPYSQQVVCGTSNVSDLQETGTAGSSSLAYDPSSDQYIYVWKTESSWAGTCRMLTVKLDDGSTHTATFKFK